MSQPVTVFGSPYRIPDRFQTTAGFHLGTFLAAIANDGAIKAVKAATQLVGATGNVAVPGDAGALITNTGATGSVTVTLPAASASPAGTSYSFVVTAAQTLIVAAPSGKLNGLAQTAKTTATLTGVGTSVTVACVDGVNWFVTSQIGVTQTNVTFA